MDDSRAKADRFCIPRPEVDSYQRQSGTGSFWTKPDSTVVMEVVHKDFVKPAEYAACLLQKVNSVSAHPVVSITIGGVFLSGKFARDEVVRILRRALRYRRNQ